MFSAIPNNYDKSEGSIIYDAVVGVAIALEDGYIEMDSMIDNLFAETATSEYLEKITAELGVFKSLQQRQQPILKQRVQKEQLFL